MKKIISLLLLFVFAVCLADTKTLPNGGTVTLANTNEMVLTFTPQPGITGCVGASVEIITSASGVKVAFASATPTWTDVQTNVQGAKIIGTYCFPSLNPNQKIVNIRLKSIDGGNDVVRVTYVYQN